MRRLSSPYKFGRSTLKEGYLLKVKKWEDSEARIVGYENLQTNLNEAVIDERGYTKRSSAKEGKVDTESLGALFVKDLQTGVEFKVGSGFTQDERERMWADQDNLIGKIITYKYFPVGVKDKPRFPIFKGFRSLEDMA